MATASTLQGAAVVIVGGSSGMGLATAQAVIARGAHVTITGRSEERLRDAATVLGGDVRTVALDSADVAGTRALFAAMDTVDHIFMSAGTVGSGGLGIDVEAMRPALDTRLWGSVLVAKYGAPRMAASGSITLCSGTSSIRPRRGGSPVSAAACAAVESLARSLALELAPIRVNTIIPGLVDTPLITAALGDQRETYLNDAARRLPVGRVGNAGDIAHAVVFLMENGFISGTTLLIDGGGTLV